MFETLGDRITYCRSLLGLTRKGLSDQIRAEISLPTLTRWELDNTEQPNTKKIMLLVDFFKNHGLNVTKEWITKGLGLPPISIHLKDFQDGDFDIISYNTMATLRNRIKHFHFAQINNNFFRPILAYGDYIAGIITENFSAINGKLCFFCSESHTIAGILDYTKKNIINLNGEIQDINFSEYSIGEIQWISRRP
jgi:transcriptional regulator with XRE-family HTH domain